jgi:cytochrome P450
LITRYEDVSAFFKDERFVKDERNALTPERLDQVPPEPEVMERLSKSMLDTDPPDHERLRALVSKAFTRRSVERMRGRVHQIADALLDAVEEKGEMDLIADYAYPLPFTVISELLGVPEEDRGMLREWSSLLVPGNATQEYVRIPFMWVFHDSLREMFEEKRKNPEEDLISALARAQQAGGEEPSEDETLSTVLLLFEGGHRTTVNLIGNGVLALLRHPDQLQKLRNDPSLIVPAVEEMLRYDGPLETSTGRLAREDVAIGETVIPKGEQVTGVIAAADRDPERFADPDTLNITRQDNKHLAFGRGMHYCLGAPLARMEGRIAIGTLLRRLPDLRLKGSPESLSWRPDPVMRGLEGLPVEF